MSIVRTRFGLWIVASLGAAGAFVAVAQERGAAPDRLAASAPAPPRAPARPAAAPARPSAPAPGAAFAAARPVDVREAARRATERRLVVSVGERRLWVMEGSRQVFTAPIAVGKGTRLEYGSRSWRFVTPRGVRRVLGKEANPVWTPPEWHYVELAQDSGWAMVRLERGRQTPTPDGGVLTVRGDRIVHLPPQGLEEVIPADEEVIFGTTLYVPPMGTANRRIAGELGAYKLDLGGGYMLHGTPHKDSIGQAATHGCIRLGDADIEHLYRTVPVGTPVYIY